MLKRHIDLQVACIYLKWLLEKSGKNFHFHSNQKEQKLNILA